MAEINAAAVRNLREQTGAGMMDCKNALMESDGDVEKAVAFLRTKGLAAAAKRAGRETREGLIFSYIHTGGKVGVLMEINCESDFVARTPDFQDLCKDLGMQIAAANPISLDRDDFSEKILQQEIEIFKTQAAESGKPPEIVERMIEGRVGKLYQERTLLEQPFVKDPAISVGERIKNAIAKLGENIAVRRFTRYQLGE